MAGGLEPHNVVWEQPFPMLLSFKKRHMFDFLHGSHTNGSMEAARPTVCCINFLLLKNYCKFGSKY